MLKPWRTYDEVIERANNTRYGLAAVVITKDMNASDKLIRSL